MNTVIQEIEQERVRQIEKEGWSTEHDNMHDSGEMAQAAACYAHPQPPMDASVPSEWPWDRKWWKPTSRRRNLIKAASLITAEVQRLDRMMAARDDCNAGRGGFYAVCDDCNVPEGPDPACPCCGGAGIQSAS